MASLALGVAGAVIGGIVGGPTGAQLGWTFGETIGAQFDKKPTEGPKLADLRVTTSTWAAPIARVFGKDCVGGNIIWSTPLIPHKEAVGGKGGPSSYEYEYTCSFAIALCEGPIIGVPRMWKDGQLLLDLSGDETITEANGDTSKIITRPDGSVVSDINQVTQAETTLASLDISRYMKVYYGTEDQLPSPTIIEHEGEDNVSAYRGIAYIEFIDLPLKHLNNSVAGNWRFEVVTAGSTGATSIHAFNLEPERIGTDAFAAGNVVACGIDPTSTRFAIQRPSGQIEAYTSTAGVPTTQQAAIHLTGVALPDSLIANTIGPVARDGGGFAALEAAAGENFDYIDTSNLFSQLTSTYSDRMAVIYDSNGFVIDRVRVSTYAGRLSAAHAYNSDGSSTFAIAENLAANRPVFVYKPGETPYIPRGLAATTGFVKLAIGDNQLFVVTHEGKSVFAYDLSQDNSAAPDAIAIPENQGVAAISYVNGMLYASSLDLTDGSTSEILACKYSAGERAFTTLARYTPPAGMRVRPNGTSAVLWTDGGSAAMVDSQTTPTSGSPQPNGALLISFNTTKSSPITVSDIVTKICERAGMAANDFDCSALTDTIPGYSIAGKMAGRGAIDPLLQYSFADACESDDILRFVKRGGAPAFDIPAGDLGATSNLDQPTDLIKIERTESLELPRELAVVYLSLPATYAPASQYSRRLTQPGANKEAQISVPIVMDDDKAAQMADVLLYDAWTSRTVFAFETSMQYAAIMPTDVGYITQQDGRKYLVRITKKDEAGGIIKFQAVAEDSEVYTAKPAAIPMTSANQSIGYAGPTDLMLLDLPILRDADAPGLYAAVAGYMTGWHGAAVYRSTDDITYTAATSFSKTIFYGAATNALPNFASGNVVDETSRLTVRLATGSLYSITDADLLEYKNAALIGDEIVLFRTAQQIDDKTYVLSGFLRGRKGTEFAMANHQAGERFVLLDATRMGDLTLPRGDIGVERSYKAVSFGQYLENTNAQSFTWAGAAYRPLAPVHIEGGKVAGGDIQLQWIPRTRTDGEWHPNGDVQLSDPEHYDLEIYAADGTTLKRTIAGLTAANTTYTAAQQTADFGAAASIFVVRVYHISQIVGRGKPGVATIKL